MAEERARVANWMNKNFLAIDYQSLISEALDLIMQVELSELPIIKDNKVIGVFNFKYYLHALSNENISNDDQVTNWMTQTYAFTSDKALMIQVEITTTYVLNESRELIGEVDKKYHNKFYLINYKVYNNLNKIIKILNKI